MRDEVRDCASARPAGWDHRDWLSFLETLRERGYDTEDHESIGRSLERERLVVTLEQIRGLGPRRIEALADRFGTLWDLRQADVDEIASIPNIPRSLAERVREAVR